MPHDGPEEAIASRAAPPIPGLYVFPTVCGRDVARLVLEGISNDDLFIGGSRDQVMLFGSSPSDDDYDPIISDSSLPSYITGLLDTASESLRRLLPPQAFQAVFAQDLARQVIINLYQPGQGISSHIDLPNRYADGILGISLCGGCTMSFRRNDGDERYDTYIPPLSIYVLTGEARWDWSHGIDPRTEDVVLNEDGRIVTLLRAMRVSVTFRWMKDGANVLGHNVDK